MSRSLHVAQLARSQWQVSHSSAQAARPHLREPVLLDSGVSISRQLKWRLEPRIKPQHPSVSDGPSAFNQSLSLGEGFVWNDNVHSSCEKQDVMDETLKCRAALLFGL